MDRSEITISGQSFLFVYIEVTRCTVHNTPGNQIQGLLFLTGTTFDVGDIKVIDRRTIF